MSPTDLSLHYHQVFEIKKPYLTKNRRSPLHGVPVFMSTSEGTVRGSGDFPEVIGGVAGVCSRNG